MTYQLVSETVVEASRQFGSECILNEGKYKKLIDICSLADSLIREFECESYGVDVDDISLDLTISIDCEEIIIENGREHEFFKLISLVDSFSFSKAKQDTLRVEFKLRNMWERV